MVKRHWACCSSHPEKTLVTLYNRLPWGDTTQASLLIPKREPMADQSHDHTEVQLGEPMDFC